MKLVKGLLFRENDSFVQVDEKEELRQHVENSIRLVLGDFSLEPLEGIKWLSDDGDSLVDKPFTVSKLRSEIVRVLDNDPRITRIVALNVTLVDIKTRDVKVALSLVGDENITLDLTEQFPSGPSFG